MADAKLPAEHVQPPFHVVPAAIIHTWPVGTFVENLAILDDGSIIVSIHSHNKLDRIFPDGTSASLFAQMPAPASGLIAVGNQLYACGGEIGKAPGYMWHVSSTGAVEQFLTIDEALFLNGFTPIRPGFAFVVDSLLGAIFEVDFVQCKYSLWLQHELLTKCSDDPMQPGVNGIKTFGDSITVTNTDRALVLKIGILPDGRYGGISVIADALRGDDFAFDDSGALYITTHNHNSLVRVSPSGERIAIAGPDEGMVGASACAFGRRPDDRHSLYVTTTGGLIMPYEGKLQPAKLVRLDVGNSGYPLPTI